MQYFFSFLPCALKVNGEYKGIITTEPKGLVLKERDFIEFVSLNSEFLPLCFLLKSPPQSVRRLCSKFGDFIYPLGFTSYPLGFQELFSISYGDIKIKVVCEGCCKLNLYSSAFSTSLPLPSKPSSCEVLFVENGYIGILLGLNRPSIYILDLNCGKEVLFYQADKFEYSSGTLLATYSPPTLLSHTVKTEFSSSGKSQKISRGKSLSQLNEMQLKYAFLECVCLKDNICDFLSPEIESSNFLSFIGQFECIMPSLSPSHDFSLVGENLRFIKLELSNQKITDAIID